MRRRELITLAGAVTWPLAARAQPAERMRRIGVLMSVVCARGHAPLFLSSKVSWQPEMDRQYGVDPR